MTAFNSHPFANPFNQRRFSNFSFCNDKSANPKLFTTVKDPSTLEVPQKQGSIFGDDPRKELTVPNQDVPYANGYAQINGFIGKSSLFRLQDGSVLDLEKRKIVYDPKMKFKAQGYWGDPNEQIERHYDNSWRETQLISQIMTDASNGIYNDPNLSPSDAKYWNKAREESKRLEQNMTDRQKELLNDLNSGKIFPLSKLEEEK